MPESHMPSKAAVSAIAKTTVARNRDMNPKRFSQNHASDRHQDAGLVTAGRAARRVLTLDCTSMNWHPNACLLVIGLAFMPAAGAAQDVRIQQARQTGANVLSPAQDSPLPTNGEQSFSPLNSGEDWESFGVQQFLREVERIRHFRVSPEISAYRTNNVALTRRNPRADSFVVAIFPCEFRQALGKGFQVEADFRYSAFRYSRFPQLDFNSVDAGIGVSYQSAALGGISTFLRYNFSQLNNAATGDMFFRNHSISLGVQKPFVFSQAHYAYVGVMGNLGFSDPKSAERSELSVFAGYHLQATRKLEADLSWRTSLYYYSEGGREDSNHTVSLALRYRFTEWLSIATSSFATWNTSNQEAFSYESANAGGGVGVTVAF
jgi:hypothetical protein